MSKVTDVLQAAAIAVAGAVAPVAGLVKLPESGSESAAVAPEEKPKPAPARVRGRPPKWARRERAFSAWLVSYGLVERPLVLTGRRRGPAPRVK